MANNSNSNNVQLRRRRQGDGSRWKVSKPLTGFTHLHETLDGTSRVVRYLSVTTLVELWNGDLMSGSEDFQIKRWKKMKKHQQSLESSSSSSSSGDPTLDYSFDEFQTFSGHSAPVDKVVQLTEDCFLSVDKSGVIKTWSLTSAKCLHTFESKGRKARLKGATCLIRSETMTRVMNNDYIDSSTTPASSNSNCSSSSNSSVVSRSGFFNGVALVVGFDSGNIGMAKMKSPSTLDLVQVFRAHSRPVSSLIELQSYSSSLSSTATAMTTTTATPSTPTLCSDTKLAWLASASVDGSVKQWEIDCQSLLCSVRTSSSNLLSINSFIELSNGNVAASYPNVILVWNRHSNIIVSSNDNSKLESRSIAGTKVLTSLWANKQIVALCQDGIVRVSSEEEDSVVATATAMSCSCMITLDDGTLASGFRNGKIKLWRVLPWR